MSRTRASAKAAGRITLADCSADLPERLLGRLEQSEPGCWEWPGATNNAGYGQIGIGGGSRRSMLVHRAMWEIAHRTTIPEGMVVRHRCDNPPCCNPDHLEIGTEVDNRRDSMNRGRHAIGETHGHTRLSDSAVRAIRRQYRVFTIPGQRGLHSNSSELAEEFGVTPRYIKAVARGEERRHVS